MCSLEHIKQLVGTSPMPKRLIDLGASNGSPTKPKIIHTRGRQEQYVALSYCWGSAQHFRTTNENFSEMQKSIPIELLPQTIRDAFLVAQKLDIRYIWVDALCIIQDNADDWDSEAKRMGAIYANSYFTIAATAAKDSREGFLWPRTLSRVSVPFRRSATSESEGTVYFRQLSDFLRDHQEYVLNSPLQQRAWVLQETLLSRRIVHFSSKQIYWECRYTFGAEDDATNDADCMEHGRKFLNMLSTLQGGGCLEHHAMIFFPIWAGILSRYSTLSISRPGDKLPALSGLASLVERIIGCRYLYGIWNLNLPYGLFWQPVSRPIHRTDEWRAPSWSWAAWQGEIIFEKYFPVEDSRICFKDVSESSQLRGALKLEGQIRPCYVSLDLQSQPKPCRSDRKLKEIPNTPHEYAFAEDKSKLLEYQSSNETDPYDLYGEASGISLLRITEGRLMSAQNPGERNVCRFDAERGTETDFFFFRLSCASRMKFHHCRGLLLRCVTGATGVYERVGVGWSTDSCWHTAPESVVTLI
jgi:Heterokaryon incompatibility protein (HET)